MLKKHILTIAKEIRQDIIDLFGNTDGVCDNACSRLRKKLIQNGYKCSTKIGRYVKGDIDLFHWWIEIDNYILDITADQFGGPEIVFAPKNKLPMYTEDL